MKLRPPISDNRASSDLQYPLTTAGSRIELPPCLRLDSSHLSVANESTGVVVGALGVFGRS